eukprot:818421-Prymnesium_polylepis.1
MAAPRGSRRLSGPRLSRRGAAHGAARRALIRNARSGRLRCARRLGPRTQDQEGPRRRTRGS